MLLQSILSPVLVQIAISHLLKEWTLDHVHVSFIVMMLLFNLPLSAMSVKMRLDRDETAFFMETWLNCSFVLQSLLYFQYENRFTLSRSQWACVLGVLMNEVSLYGGDWFGHRVLTTFCLFSTLKILTSTVAHEERPWVHYGWQLLVYFEFLTYVLISLMDIWTNANIKWFVMAFLLSVPHAFPTSNAERQPKESLAHGLLSFHKRDNSITNLLDEDLVQQQQLQETVKNNLNFDETLHFDTQSLMKNTH